MDQIRPRRRPSIGGLGIVSDHTGQVVALKDGRVGGVYDQVTHRVVGIGAICCCVRLSPRAGVRKPRRPTVNRVPRRPPKTVGGQDLDEAGLLPQTLHLLIIFAVKERLVRRGSYSVARRHRYAEHRHIDHLFFPQDRLVVQALAHAQRQDHPGSRIRETVGLIFAGQVGNIGDNIEKRIRVDEERIRFPVRGSDRKPSKSVPRPVTYGLLRF